MRRFIAILTCILCLFSAGCRGGSPYAGAWAGRSEVSEGSGLLKFAFGLAGSALEGPSTLTLKPDGTGFLKIAGMPELAVSWKGEDKKLILWKRPGPDAEGSNSSGKSEEKGNSIVGTLSEDGQTLTLDMGQLLVTLKRQGDAG